MWKTVCFYISSFCGSGAITLGRWIIKRRERARDQRKFHVGKANENAPKITIQHKHFRFVRIRKTNQKYSCRSHMNLPAILIMKRCSLLHIYDTILSCSISNMQNNEIWSIGSSTNETKRKKKRCLENKTNLIRRITFNQIDNLKPVAKSTPNHFPRDTFLSPSICLFHFFFGRLFHALVLIHFLCVFLSFFFDSFFFFSSSSSVHFVMSCFIK